MEATSMNNSDAQNERLGTSPNTSNQNGNGFPRANRPSNRVSTVQSSTNRDFEGATPKLGAVLALRNENVNKKMNYDRFLEKLAIYMVNEF